MLGGRKYKRVTFCLIISKYYYYRAKSNSLYPGKTGKIIYFVFYKY